MTIELKEFGDAYGGEGTNELAADEYFGLTEGRCWSAVEDGTGCTEGADDDGCCPWRDWVI